MLGFGGFSVEELRKAVIRLRNVLHASVGEIRDVNLSKPPLLAAVK
jgi:hypothetical protein